MCSLMWPGMYYKFHQRNYDNANSCPTNEVPTTETMSFLKLLDEQMQLLYAT